MKKAVFLLLFVLAGLFGFLPYLQAHTNSTPPPLSGKSLFQQPISFQQQAHFETGSNSEKPGSRHFFVTDVDQEDEEDFLQKHLAVARFVVAYVTTYSQQQTGQAVHSLPFFQHQPDAAFPRHIRLSVFRI